MSVVEIDERGRMTIPKKMRVEADLALVIPMGESHMLVPIPKAAIEFERRESSETAEKKLKADVRERLARRRQR